MPDLKSPRLIYLKAVLFVLLGLLASILLIWDRPTLGTVALLGIAIWSFARAYYFVF